MHREHSPDLRQTIERKLLEFPAKSIAPFLTPLREKIGDRARAIVIYGSTLSDVTKSATSTPDFYVTTQHYSSFHKSFCHALMNRWLPPNVYHFTVGGEISKYNVISERDLRKVTSPHARDVYHLGRFSKRIALAWHADDSARNAVVDAQLSALRSISLWACRGLPHRFSLGEFVRKALGLSYEGEFRVEAQDKIDKLYLAEKEHYDCVFSLVLAEMDNVARQPDGTYVRPVRSLYDAWDRFRLRRFLRRSRLRAKLRWPKSMITVEHWVEYVLMKIERTHRIKIELTERERKYPLIYGWKYLLRLRRQNVAK